MGIKKPSESRSRRNLSNTPLYDCNGAHCMNDMFDTGNPKINPPRNISIENGLAEVKTLNYINTYLYKYIYMYIFIYILRNINEIFHLWIKLNLKDINLSRNALHDDVISKKLFRIFPLFQQSVPVV